MNRARDFGDVVGGCIAAAIACALTIGMFLAIAKLIAGTP